MKFRRRDEDQNVFHLTQEAQFLEDAYSDVENQMVVMMNRRLISQPLGAMALVRRNPVVGWL